MNKFEKVSFEQYIKDCNGYNQNIPDDDINMVIEIDYNNIKLPKRATKFSAGYDFFAPFSFRNCAEINATHSKQQVHYIKKI